MRKIMLIDVALCHDCNNCFMACKDEYCDNESLYDPTQPKHGHRWINILRRERGQFPMIDMAFLPLTCQQCSNSPCVKHGNGAVEKLSNGIVKINHSAAKGMRELVDVCPYGAIYYNDEYDCPQKCEFCLQLLEQGAAMPRCVEVCPTGALTWKEVSESEYSDLLRDGWQIYGNADSPSVLYRNLSRFTKHFIGGSVIKNNDCLEGASVTLEQNGKIVAQTTTNGFGDFKFDYLDIGTYVVIIIDGNTEKRFEIDLEDARSLGVIHI